MTQKKIETDTLCVSAGMTLRDMSSRSLLNYDDFQLFQRAMIYLATNYITSLDHEQSVMESLIRQLSDPNLPTIDPFIVVFNSFFNCNILNVILDINTFELIEWSETVTISQTDDTDHVIIINLNRIHFCIIMPKNTGDPITYHQLRKQIYELMKIKCNSLIPLF
jgi:hypothetical protein